MAFQYIMPSPVDLSDVFAQIGKGRQAEKDRELKRSEMLLRQQASDRDQARLDEQLRQASVREQRQQGIDVANSIPKIQNMLTPGHPEYDPPGGMSLAKALGINLGEQAPPDPGQAPVAPIRQQNIEEGPRETPEIAQQAGLIRSLQRTPGDAPPEIGAKNDQTAIDAAEAERKRFAQANETQPEFDAKQAAYLPQAAAFQEASKRLPTYTGESPIGPVNFDPNRIVAAREAERARQQAQLAPLGQIPGAEKMQPVIQAMISAGMPGSEVAKFVSEASKEAHADEEKKTYNKTAADQIRHDKEMERIGWRAAGSRADEQKTRDQDKADNTVVRGDSGDPIGRVPTGKGGAQGFATRDADYARAENALQAYRDHVAKFGTRPTSIQDIRDRQALYDNAVIGVATVSPLGKTIEAQKLEAGSLGPSGAPDLHNMTGVLTGANPEAIDRKLEEVRHQREQYRTQTLIPMAETPPHVRVAPSKNETRAKTLRSGGKSAPTMDDLVKFEREHGL